MLSIPGIKREHEASQVPLTIPAVAGLLESPVGRYQRTQMTAEGCNGERDRETEDLRQTRLRSSFVPYTFTVAIAKVILLE